MLFGTFTRSGPRNHVLDGVKPTREGAILTAKGAGLDMPGHVRRPIYSKQVSIGQHRYGVDAEWDVLDGVHIVATWRMRLKRPCAVAMRP